MATMLTPITAVIKFKSWCQIDRANPTVNQNLNGATLAANSDTVNSYDGTTAAQKMIFNFEKPVTLSGKMLLNFGATLSPGSSITFSGGNAGTLGGGLLLGSNVRIRPITASFVTANQNWNNFASLTLGTAATIGGPSASAVAQGTGTSFANGYTGMSASALIKTCLVPATVSAVYGYVIDIQPTFSQPLNGSFVTSAISAAIQAGLLTTTTPYLVKSQ